MGSIETPASTPADLNSVGRAWRSLVERVKDREDLFESGFGGRRSGHGLGDRRMWPSRVLATALAQGCPEQHRICWLLFAELYRRAAAGAGAIAHRPAKAAHR